MKYIVYLTTNLVNNKIYIGVHQTKDPNVFDNYLGCAVYANQPSSYNNPHTQFQCAVKKFGPKNFKRIILEVFDDKSQAYLKEKELVNREFVNREDTYNMILGGIENCIEGLPVYQFKKDGTLVKHWEHTSDAIEFFNCGESSISNAIHFKESLFGYYFSRNSSIDIKEYSKGDSKKIVYKYSKGGKLLNIYSSVKEASEKENLSGTKLPTAISQCQLINKLYYFSHTLYEEFIPTPRKSLKKAEYWVYNLEGNFLKHFTKSKDLMSYLNVKSWATIHRVIHGQNGHYKDWQLYTENKGDKVPSIESFKNVSKQVEVFDLTGKSLKVCDSVQQCCKEFDVKLSSVNRVLRGGAHQTKGYVFKWYVNDIV